MRTWIGACVNYSSCDILHWRVCVMRVHHTVALIAVTYTDPEGIMYPPGESVR